MSDFPELEHHGRVMKLVPAASFEHWTGERARELMRTAIADPQGRAALLELADALGCPSQELDPVVEFLARELEDGRLIPIRLPEAVVGEFVDPRTDPGGGDDPIDPTPRDDDHFVEIVLLDEGGAPVPDARYELTLPDGNVVRGRLDFDGAVRRDRIPAGSCWIEFPGLDAPAPAPHPRADAAEPDDAQTYELAPDLDEPIEEEAPAPPELQPPAREQAADDDDIDSDA